MEALVFDHVPSLRELLPRTGGLPGVVYAQVCAHHGMRAQQEDYKLVRLAGGNQFYQIRGPKGSVDMMLVGKGDPIPGANPYAGSRRCLVAGVVYHYTGLPTDLPEDHLKQLLAEESRTPTPVTPEGTQEDIPIEVLKSKPSAGPKRAP